MKTKWCTKNGQISADSSQIVASKQSMHYVYPIHGDPPLGKATLMEWESLPTAIGKSSHLNELQLTSYRYIYNKKKTQFGS